MKYFRRSYKIIIKQYKTVLTILNCSLQHTMHTSVLKSGTQSSLLGGSRGITNKSAGQDNFDAP